MKELIGLTIYCSFLFYFQIRQAVGWMLLPANWRLGTTSTVMDLPLYTMVSRSELSDLGSVNYHQFDYAIILDQVMRQAGNNDTQQQFRDILMLLRNGELSVEDWKHLIKQTLAEAEDPSSFNDALRLFPSTAAVSEYNVAKLHANGQPVSMIKAVHSGPGASKVSTDDAGGLEPIACLAQGARVMLTANFWVQAGLVNGAMGTVVAICYDEAGESPPNLPVAVTVRFDSYCGPTLPDGTVPIIPLRRTWLSTEKQSSRLQLPLKLAWAVTIHKCQGMTLNKTVIDVGKKEFSAGLTFVACSRVRQLKDLLFVPPFPFQRVANLAKSHRYTERLREEKRLQGLNSKQLTCKMAQPIVETEIVAVEADGAKTKPNIPMCKAQGQVIFNASVVASPVVRPVNQKSPDIPDIPDAQAKAVDMTGELEITRVELNTSQFRYYHSNAEWQQRICEELQLEYRGPNGIASGSPSTPLTNPTGFKNIRGDGNCMFRAFSFIITGSEDQHMLVRHAII